MAHRFADSDTLSCLPPLTGKRWDRGSKQSGFTLIELIVTVGILAVLTTIVVVALNPAEQLRRARDAKRVADLDALKSALNLYMAQATTTVNLSGDTTANDRCIGGSSTSTYFANTTGISKTYGSSSNLPASATSVAQLVATSSPVLPAGSWMPVLLGQTAGGSPLEKLPLDPSNGAGDSIILYYGYACRVSNKTFELTARLESTYYLSDLNLYNIDGGNSSSTYEVGTDLTIIPPGEPTVGAHYAEP